MDGWNTSFLLGWSIFRCYVSFRECNGYLVVWGPVVWIPIGSPKMGPGIGILRGTPVESQTTRPQTTNLPVIECLEQVKDILPNWWFDKDESHGMK